jgi:hypothetical protein
MKATKDWSEASLEDSAEASHNLMRACARMQALHEVIELFPKSR